MSGNYIIMIILGIVQGIAEFLPVSSSGHLVILENLDVFKNAINSVSEDSFLLINVALHLATLLAVIIYLWRDLYNLIKGAIIALVKRNFRQSELLVIRNIIIASIPAGIIGILLHDFIEDTLSNAYFANFLLIINGFILLGTRLIRVKDKTAENIFISSFLVGIFQAIAILPGISRSGMTITGSLLSGLKPLESARFSFLIAIPVIAGAGLVEGLNALDKGIPSGLIMPLLASMLVTAVVALICLKILFHLMKKVRIHVFGYYTIFIGILGLVYLFVKKM